MAPFQNVTHPVDGTYPPKEHLFYNSQHIVGILAAFREANEGRLIDASGGVTLELLMQNTPVNFGSGRPAELIAAGVNMGFLLPGFPGTHTAFAAARANGLPLVGGLAVEPELLTRDRFAVNVRIPLVHELYHMHRFAMFSRLRCNRIAIVAYAAEALKQLVNVTQALLADHGFPVADVLFADESIGDPAKVPAIKAMLRNAPQCFYFFLPTDIIAYVVQVWHATPGFRPDDTFFLSISVGGQPVYESQGSSHWFQNLFIVQQFPDPTNEKFDLVRNYQTAMRRLDATRGTPGGFSPNWGYDVNLATPNYYGLEGYVLGRFVVEVLRTMRVGNMTPVAFLDTVYRNGMVNVDDYPLGPYSDGCVGRRAELSPHRQCFCNVGNHGLFMSRVSGVNGSTSGVADNTTRGEIGVAASYVPLHLCSPNLASLRRPFLFVQPLVTTSPATAHTTGETAAVAEARFAAALRRAFAFVETRRSRGEVAVAVALSMEQLAIAEFNAASASTTNSSNVPLTARIVQRYGPVAFLGSAADGTASDSTAAAAATAVEVAGIPVFGRADGLLDLEDPPPRLWRREAIALDPTLADYAHALAAMAARGPTTFNASSPVAHGLASGGIALVLGSSAQEVALGVKSCHTFQFRVTSAVVTTATALTEALARASGNVLVVTQVPALVVALVDFALSSARSGPHSFFVATNEASIHDAVFFGRARIAEQLARSSVYFASVLGPWWATTVAPNRLVSTYYQSVADVLGPRSPSPVRAGVNASQPPALDDVPHPAEFFALRMTLLLEAAASSVVGSPVGPSGLLTAFYSAGSIAALDTALGRLFDRDCGGGSPEAALAAAASPARECRCSKGPRVFTVHAVRDIGFHFGGGGSNTQQEQQQQNYQPFAYTLPGCGVQYGPLLESEQSNTVLIAGTSSAAAFVAIIAAVVVFRVVRAPMQRDNSAAPQDESVPFTICFTDIQSSTPLWSRVPEAMAPAIDAHHKLCRVQIKKHNGYEVKTIGDSFMVVFDAPERAVAFASDLQLALLAANWGPGGKAITETYAELAVEERTVGPGKRTSVLSVGNSSGVSPVEQPALVISDDSVPRINIAEVEDAGAAAGVRRCALDPAVWGSGLRVRVAIHHGIGRIKFDEISRGFDYYGTVVNTAARVEGVAHGGQIIATSAVIDALALAVGSKSPIEPPSNSVEDASAAVLRKCGVVATPLGAVPLRGVDTAVELVQLLPAPLATRVFPPLRVKPAGRSKQRPPVPATAPTAPTSPRSGKGGDSDDGSCGSSGSGDDLENFPIDDDSGNASGRNRFPGELRVPNAFPSDSAGSAQSDTPECMAERAARRNPRQLRTLLHNYAFIKALLSTTDAAARLRIVGDIRRRWRMAPMSWVGRPAGLERDTMGLTIRVTPVAEEAFNRLWASSGRTPASSIASAYSVRSSVVVARDVELSPQTNSLGPVLSVVASPRGPEVPSS